MEPNETSAGAPSEQNDATMQNDSNMTVETPSVDVAVGAEAIVASEEIAESGKTLKDDTVGGMMAGGAEPKKNGKGMLIGMVLFALLAAGGIGFGVWTMMDGNNQAKTLNNQISDLKKTNSELQDELAKKENQSVEEEVTDDVVIEMENVTNRNPVLKATQPNYYYLSEGTVGMGYDQKTLLARITVDNGVISKCEYNGNNCSISGINEGIYKMSDLSYGNGGGMDKLGFLMEDGSVYYISSLNYDEEKHIFKAKKLSIDGFVKDIVRLELGNKESNYGPSLATLMILSDNTFVSFNDEMQTTE